ncbi:MAG: hypothetical protein E7812_17430 [Phenylobacterium sp.]|nr:MAG: hypothetical protein E7812_17430 [Phenylobacterium sp.]
MSIADLFNLNTPARYLAKRQHKHPPIYQPTPANWQGLFGVALAMSTPELQAMVARGEIVSGEVGELSPSTYVTRHGRGYAIEMHSGEMRLIYSAARAIAASDDGRFRDAEASSLSAESVEAKIAELFGNFDVHGVATSQAFPATAAQRAWADAIACNAECFLLLHELAHIHNGDLTRPPGDEAEVRRREAAADATACGWLVDYVLAPKPGGPQRQMLYAGAEFGLRVRMAMEAFGLKFNATHPSAGDRVAAMRERLRAAAGSRTFYAIANTSLAFDQMWRAVERIRQGLEPKYEPGLDDVLASLRTLTVEFLRANDEGVREAILDTAKRDFRDLPKELRAAVRRQAGEVFEPGVAEYEFFLALLSASDPEGSPA